MAKAKTLTHRNFAKTYKYCGTHNMAKGILNKTKQDLKYHSTQAYNLGNHYQQELKPTLFL